MEKEKTFAIVTRTCCDAPAKFAQNVKSSLIERTMRLNGYWVKGVCEGRLGYFASLSVAAISAAVPDSRADASTYESAVVQMTVTS